MISMCSRSLRVCILRRWNAVYFTSSSIIAGRQANPPLLLDPSLQALLHDADMSLLNRSDAPSYRELEIFPDDIADIPTFAYSDESLPEDSVLGRKSPAAGFGSEKIGAVVLPPQLTKSISRLIQDSNKALLHVDAKRLFLHGDAANDGECGWDTQYDIRYRSRGQSVRHAERDGTAFASVALPAHYSAIVAVLHHLKTRLGPSWAVKNVIDWGAGAGSGLWASIHSFQVHEPKQIPMEPESSQLSDSSITRYIGIDKREELTSIGKRLLHGIHSGDLQISWQRTLKESNREDTKNGHALALSSFLLSSLPTDIARKKLVKEMWESGAEVIVLIDHKSVAGFKAIAEAREYLLKLGRNELEESREQDFQCTSKKGSHVIAPCPHDAACPLHRSGTSRLACGFSQRIQRPDFVRRTKHSKKGHENTEYSYVAIRRGVRPSTASTQAGRIGEVGIRALQKDQSQILAKELTVHDGSELTSYGQGAAREPETPVLSAVQSPEELEKTLRQESYSWPRLIFPPLKRSGHVILDGCTAEGKLRRMIIPRSQGQQPYYDARKSSWGDIFPHPPKNPGQERHFVSKGRKDNDAPEDRSKKAVSEYGKSARLQDYRRTSR